MEIYYSPKAKEELFRIKDRILEVWDDDKLAVKTLSQITLISFTGWKRIEF